jgi:triacylglycerol lipase
VADQNARTSSTKRLHVVLVPGFAGFDALGQLEYYGGITPLFQTWLTGNQVLHYFDNFPTAAVVTRATGLRSYLAKRLARGEISNRDDVILVGHSSGGLDIRWLLWDLYHRKSADCGGRWSQGRSEKNPQVRASCRVSLRTTLGHQHRRLGALPRPLA